MMRLAARSSFSCLSSFSVITVAPTASAVAVLSFFPFLDEVPWLLIVLRALRAPFQWGWERGYLVLGIR